jgi:hypothetical protein
MNSQLTTVSFTYIKGIAKPYVPCPKRIFMLISTIQETQEDKLRLLTGCKQFSTETIKQLHHPESHFYVPTSNHLFPHFGQNLWRASA